MDSIAVGSIEARMADTTTQFGLQLINTLAEDVTVKNVAMSPLSIQIVLNMILLGANNNSVSQNEIVKVLNYETTGLFAKNLSADEKLPHKAMYDLYHNMPVADELDFKLANLIATNSDKIKLKQEFRDDLGKYYDVNFEQYSGGKVEQPPLHERINSWVRNETRNQIHNLVGESDFREDHILSVVNAAYFKGRWFHVFHKSATKKKTFYNDGLDTGATEVDFMNRQEQFGFAAFGVAVNDSSRGSSEEEKRQFELTSKLNCTALKMPFSLDNGQEYSMVFLLPTRRDGLRELRAALNTEKLNAIYKMLDNREHEVIASLPKFTFEYSINDAKSQLRKMGLNSMFEWSNDFTRMYSGIEDPVKVDKIIHKAKINCDEEGAEAAAATLGKMTFLMSLIRESPQRFEADHPFLFIIRHDKSNLPLFMGQVTSL